MTEKAKRMAQSNTQGTTAAAPKKQHRAPFAWFGRRIAHALRQQPDEEQAMIAVPSACSGSDSHAQTAWPRKWVRHGFGFHTTHERAADRPEKNHAVRRSASPTSSSACGGRLGALRQATPKRRCGDSCRSQDGILACPPTKEPLQRQTTVLNGSLGHLTLQQARAAAPSMPSTMFSQIWCRCRARSAWLSSTQLTEEAFSVFDADRHLSRP